MKTCKHCGVEKPLEDFPKNSNMKDGHVNFCFPCRYEKYYKDRLSSDKYWSQQLKWKYGISIETYNKMSEEQRGLCAVCGNDNGGKRLCVDHRHDTGKVRGLLCTSCNKAIGQLGDTPEGVLAAYNYLKETH